MDKDRVEIKVMSVGVFNVHVLNLEFVAVNGFLGAVAVPNLFNEFLESLFLLCLLPEFLLLAVSLECSVVLERE